MGCARASRTSSCRSTGWGSTRSPTSSRSPCWLEGTVRGTGGVRIADVDCATDVPGLYAAGDTATRELICGGFTGGGSHNAAWAIVLRQLGRDGRPPDVRHPPGPSGARAARTAVPVYARRTGRARPPRRDRRRPTPRAAATTQLPAPRRASRPGPAVAARHLGGGAREPGRHRRGHLPGAGGGGDGGAQPGGCITPRCNAPRPAACTSARITRRRTARSATGC